MLVLLQANRALRLASLSTLNMCVVHQSSIVASESLDLIVSEAVPLIRSVSLVHLSSTFLTPLTDNVENVQQPTPATSTEMAHRGCRTD